VRTNAPGSPHSVGCTGTGVAAPLLVPDPANLEFGLRPVGTTGGTQTVWSTSDGVADLHMASITIGGADPGDFAVEPSSTLPGLADPARGTVRRKGPLRPNALGARSAVLRQESGACGSPHTVPLVGFPVPASALTVTTTVLGFGSHPVGSTSGAGTVTVINNGQAPMELTTMVTIGGDAGEFVVVGGTCVPSSGPHHWRAVHDSWFGSPRGRSEPGLGSCGSGRRAARRRRSCWMARVAVRGSRSSRPRRTSASGRWDRQRPI
jgi:hypothetical protein